MTLSSRLFYQRSDSDSDSNSNSGSDGKHQNNNNNNNDNDDAMAAFQRHMAKVRSLQLSYYTTGTSYKDNPKQSICSLEKSTGKLLHLPIYKSSLSKFQIPGRSQVLEIDNPIYTNMFESILYKPQPWCFGHLYTHYDSESDDKNDNNDDDTVVTTWSSTKGSSPFKKNEASVLGCLMNIADYRRLSDGRLVLLVHSMERFVTTDIVQTLPYPIVNGQILPDLEEIDPSLDIADISEYELSLARAIAIQESVRYHSYEYDPHHSFDDTTTSSSSSFPYRSWSFQEAVSESRRMSTTDPTGGGISKAAIAKVLPFCPFSKSNEPPEPTTTIDDIVSMSPSSDVTGTQQHQSSAQGPKSSQESHHHDLFRPALEYELFHRGILTVPPADPEFYNSGRDYSDMSVDELEKHVWIVLNHFLITTKQPVSPVLLSLLPPTMTKQQQQQQQQQQHDGTEKSNEKWPTNFYLDKIAHDLGNLNTVDHDFVPVSANYPSYRRQRRLSFSAAYVLEEYYQDTEWKTLLLSIPSTKQRLRVVLEKFLQWQQQQWGEFQ
jgi:Lon protease-like protein